MQYKEYQPESLFLHYQREWIKDTSRLKLIEKSRQIGMSWASAYAIVRRKSIAGAKLDAWISSRDDLQARLFKEDCNSFADILQIACTDLGLSVIDPDKKISAYVLALASGCRINSMSSNPDAQAGKRGDRVLDEFALHPDPRKLWSIAYPGITWGGQMEIISTHRGSQNLFNQLVIEARDGGNPKGISLHRVTLQDALDQGFLAKLKQKLPEGDPRQDMDEADYFDFIRAGCVDEESFLQEYMCCPADDQSAFIGYELIDANTVKMDDQAEIDTDLDYYIGVDIGRTNDLTVIWIAINDNGVLRPIRLIELKDTSFSRQEEILYRYLELPHVRRCCIDATGIGRQFAERGKERFGYKVEEVVFTSGVKEDLAVSLRKHMEDGLFKIPGTKEIIADFRGIRKETTAAGNIRYVGERNSNGHSDRFWAAALCIMAAKPTGTGEVRRFASTGVARKKRRWKGLRS